MRRLRPDADQSIVEGALDDVDKSFTTSEAIKFLEETTDPKFAFIRELFVAEGEEENPLVQQLRQDIDLARQTGISDTQLAAALRKIGLDVQRPVVTSAGLVAARKQLEILKQELEAEKRRAQQVAEATKPAPPPADVMDVRSVPGPILDQLFALVPNREKLVENIVVLPKDLYFYSPSTGKLFIRANGQFVNITTASIASRIEKSLEEAGGIVAVPTPLTPSQVDVLSREFRSLVRLGLAREPFPAELEQFDMLADDLQRAGISFTPALERVRTLANSLVTQRMIAARAPPPLRRLPSPGLRRERLNELLERQLGDHLTDEEEAELEGLLFEFGTQIVEEQRAERFMFLGEVRWIVRNLSYTPPTESKWIDEDPAREYAKKLEGMGFKVEVVSITERAFGGME